MRGQKGGNKEYLRRPLFCSLFGYKPPTAPFRVIINRTIILSITPPKGKPMGRTVAPITQTFLQEEQSFKDFRRALTRGDQQALDDLFTNARQHLAAATYASHALPFEIMLLAMLLEEHKEVMRLRKALENLPPPERLNRSQ